MRGVCVCVRVRAQAACHPAACPVSACSEDESLGSCLLARSAMLGTPQALKFPGRPRLAQRSVQPCAAGRPPVPCVPQSDLAVAEELALKTGNRPQRRVRYHGKQLTFGKEIMNSM